MEHCRRSFLRIAAAAAAMPLLPHAAPGQGYPARAVRIMVGFPAGGTTDIAARIIAQWLSERLGQQFIVENRPGAATNIATEAVIHAPADGYTLLAATSTNTINPALYENLNFDFGRDVTMVAGIVRSPLVLEVHPGVPVRTVPELIGYAKADPGRISLASFGTGTSSHLAGELFKLSAGVKMVHIPYRGSSPMVTDLLSGQVQAAFDNLPASIEHIRAGKLRPLAVTTATRSQVLPDVPALGEFLKGFEASAWVGIAAPAQTPPEIVDKLSREINAALADPLIEARIANLGGDVFRSSPPELARFVAEQTREQARIVRAAHIKPE
jgi:tripartite-type tricarboxylate transporter receptor subunit TctC